jgi:uncharacterized protein (TIGR03437 family)
MKMNQTVIYRVTRLPLLATFVVGLSVLCFQHRQTATVSAQPQQVTVVNAANFNPDKRVAPDSVAAAFGQFVTQNNPPFFATTLPLPTTLGGVRLAINGVNAGLFFVSAGQINFVVPPTLQDAASATVTVTNSDNSTRTGTLTIQRAAPGIFTMRGTGQGVAAALTTFDGATFTPVFNPDLSERVVDAGTAQRRNVLVLFVTGIRNVPAQNPNDGNGVAEAVRVTLQGVPLTLLFAGAAPGLAGVDQINAYLPPEAAGLGSVDLEVSTANPAATSKITTPPTPPPTINLGPTSQLPAVRVTDINFGQTVTGELTADDQIQQISDGTKRTYFFDAYRFTTTAANTTVAIDLRTTGTTSLDPTVLLYQSVNNQLVLVAADDQTGSYENGRQVGGNALLLTVIANPGTYVAFATSADIQPNGVGAYSLRLNQNVIQQINYGANLTNVAITNTDLQTSHGTYLDAYWFTAAANDNVVISMNSTVFDSFLVLQANSGDPNIAFDDNSGGGQNARITRRIGTAGNYIIIATPYEPNKTGAYTLSLNRVTALSDEAETQSAAPGRLLRDERGEQRGGLAERVSRRVVEE